MKAYAVALVAALVVAVSAQTPAPPVTTNCQVQLMSDEQVKASYDLSGLMATQASGWYSFETIVPPFPQKPFTDQYYYNFCQNLAAPPVTSPAGKCKNSTVTGQPGNMYQLRNGTAYVTDDCHVVSVASNYSWSLVDSLNPARGVVLHHGAGDNCGSGGGEREVFITVLCKRHGQEPRIGIVSEPFTNTCDYELTIESHAGCPVECPVVNEVLCAGHGVCGPDNDLKTTRCYCNTGFGGADCSQAVVPDTNTGSSGGGHATSVLVAFVIILTIALLAMAVVLYRKIKRLNADDSRYGQLTDSDDSSKRRAAAAAHITSSGGGMTGVVSGAAAVPAAHEQDQGASSKLAAAVDANV